MNKSQSRSPTSLKADYLDHAYFPFYFMFHATPSNLMCENEVQSRYGHK